MTAQIDRSRSGRVTLFDPDAAKAAREQGIGDSDEHADQGWKLAALAAIHHVAQQHRLFTTDEVWEALLTSPEWTHEPAALGPLMLRACRDGWIAKTDTWERTKIPRRHRELLVWQSLICHSSGQQQQARSGMTNSISLEALGHDSTRRDQWNRYLIVPPIGGKPLGYTRVTTVAKALDDGGGLAPWKAAMTACGMIMRRGLRAQWESLIAQFDDPWYSGEQAKAMCKRLVEECAAVGGANDRRDMGTSLHAITALVDLGRMPSHLTEETEADIRAYVNGLHAAGIELLPEYVEVTVVLDDWQVAGTFDRLAVVPGFDLPLVADLKTGADLSYSWQSIAVQLAAYSRANAIYQQGPASDGSKDKRLTMPEVDQDYGLIMWLNAGSGTLELHVVDLEAGWGAFERSMWVRGWRRTPVAQPLDNAQFRLSPQAASQPDSLIPVLQASLDAMQEAPKKRRGRPPKQPATAETEAETEAEDTTLIDVYQGDDDLHRQGSHMVAGQDQPHRAQREGPRRPDPVLAARHPHADRSTRAHSGRA